MRALAVGIAVALFNVGALAQLQPPAQSPPAAQRERHSMPEGTSVYIIYPRSGATLRPGPVRVRFGLSEKAGVAPAGIAKANTGHHHLFIDSDIPTNLSQELPPTNPHLLHFGLGQTEVTINLPVGQHTLQLVLADENHVPHDPPVVSRKVILNVRNPPPPPPPETSR
jgi:hypothetical protein